MRLGDLDALKETIEENAEDIGGIEDVIDYIDNAPTVESNISETYGLGYEQGFRHGKEKYERPQGEWIFDEKGYFYCDKCGKYPHDQYATTDFCPNCGAEMEVTKNETYN